MDSLQITTTSLNSDNNNNNGSNNNKNNNVSRPTITTINQQTSSSLSNTTSTTTTTNHNIFSLFKNQRSVANSNILPTSCSINTTQQQKQLQPIGNSSRRTLRKTSILLSDNLVPFTSPFFSTTKINQISAMKLSTKDQDNVEEIEELDNDHNTEEYDEEEAGKKEDMQKEHKRKGRSVDIVEEIEDIEKNDGEEEGELTDVMIIKEMSPLPTPSSSSKFFKERDEENQISPKSVSSSSQLHPFESSTIRTVEETLLTSHSAANGSFNRLPYEFKTYIGDDAGNSIPRIDFEMKSNLFTWCSIRLILHSFGDRMKFRIDCYLGKLISTNFNVI